jgi:transposase
MNDSSLLANAIARKAQLLELLRKMGAAQLSLVGEGDMSRLMQVLASKDSLLQQLQMIEREIDPFRDEDPERRRWASPELRQACRRDADRCAALLAEIVALDKQSEAEMSLRRDATAAQLQGMYGSQEAQGAYIAAPASLSASFDLSMEG